MQALAMQAPIMQGIICPVIKSRSQEYYMALFERNNGEDSLLKETTLVKYAEVSRFIPANCILIGHTDDFSGGEAAVPGLQIAPACYAYLNAFTIALLGTKQLAQNKTDAIENLQPLYYQEFIAGIPKRTGILQIKKSVQ